jgi:large subunit ribosomal protein L3
MPGRKMPGRMGQERITIKNSEIAGIDEKNNTLIIKGAVPGMKGALLELRSMN